MPHKTVPRSPRDFTGKLLAQQQAAKQQELATVDIDAIRHAAYEAGREAGFSEGIQWVQENYDIYVLEDNDEGIES